MVAAARSIAKNKIIFLLLQQQSGKRSKFGPLNARFQALPSATVTAVLMSLNLNQNGMVQTVNLAVRLWVNSMGHCQEFCLDMV